MSDRQGIETATSRMHIYFLKIFKQICDVMIIYLLQKKKIAHTYAHTCIHTVRERTQDIIILSAENKMCFSLPLLSLLWLLFLCFVQLFVKIKKKTAHHFMIFLSFRQQKRSKTKSKKQKRMINQYVTNHALLLALSSWISFFFLIFSLIHFRFFLFLFFHFFFFAHIHMYCMCMLYENKHE